MKEKILELRRKGFTINEIIQELKCAKSTISYHINKVGLGGVRNDFLNDITDDVIEKIKEYRLTLKSYKEIKELVNISEDKLIKICRILNVNKPSNTFKKKELDGDEVIKYYLVVNSLRKTSEYFNTSRETVRKYISSDIIEKNKNNKTVKTKSQAVVDWRKRKKIELVEYKGGCCEKCGYKKSTSALQFHHLNPKEKDFAISAKSYSFDRLKKEVDKCIMVCANCHIELHEEINKGR